MQAYIISFCVYLCSGIVMRLLHPENLHFDLAYLIAAGFLFAGAAASLLYRIRLLAHILLTVAICVAFIALPLDNGLN